MTQHNPLKTINKNTLSFTENAIFLFFSGFGKTSPHGKSNRSMEIKPKNGYNSKSKGFADSKIELNYIIIWATPILCGVLAVPE